MGSIEEKIWEVEARYVGEQTLESNARALRVNFLNHHLRCAGQDKWGYISLVWQLLFIKAKTYSFFQVSHSQPDTEYMVDLSLDGDSYCLLGSEPPLPSLPQLQEELNASGNLIACILKIRKEYQRMSSKRPRE